MIKIRTCFFIFTILVMMPFRVAYAEAYHLGYGDILTMSIWGYQETDSTQKTSPEYAIRPDGKISFPIVGEVQANGLSIGELTSILTEGIEKYIKNPKITLNIVRFRTVRVYVLGEVVKPGLYEIEKQHNLLDAIGIAGSYTKSAAKKNIFVYHKDQVDKPLKANLFNLLNKGDMTQNVELADGDVIYLSDNGRIDFNTQIAPLLESMYEVRHF